MLQVAFLISPVDCVVSHSALQTRVSSQPCKVNLSGFPTQDSGFSPLFLESDVECSDGNPELTNGLKLFDKNDDYRDF